MEKDLSSWKVKELQAHLRKLGLKVSGKKADLIERIKSHNSNESSAFPTGIVDVDREILLNLNTRDLLDACKTNKYVIELCNNNKFMRLRLERNYGGYVMRAHAEAVSHGDFTFIKYLIDNHDISISFDNYNVFWNTPTDKIRYLIEFLDFTEDDLFALLNNSIELMDHDSVIYVIETGLVSKLINAGKDISIVYDKAIQALIDIAEPYGEAPGDSIEYVNMMKYLYENTEKSTYLKMLADLSKSRGEYRRSWII